MLRFLIKKLKGNIILSANEKKAFYLHFWYSIIEGFILGVLALNEFVFIKSLKGSNVQVGILFQITVMVLILSIFINALVKRMRNTRKLIILTGIITRLPLLILLFFPHNMGNLYSNAIYHYIFLIIFLLFYMANPLIYPVINLILKSNYNSLNFGRLYSYSTTANKIVMLLVTFLYGILLDYSPYSYRYVFAVVAILGILSSFLLASIPYTPVIQNIIKENFFKFIKATITETKSVLKNNKAFGDFEKGFMFYGFAFMGTVSVITIFYVKALHLNYSSIAFYKNTYNILAIVLLPFFGRLIGKIDPRKFAAITFASFLLYILFTALTEVFPYYTSFAGLKIYHLLNVAIFFNGIFAATMSLSWSIGSSYFCSPNDSADYQAIHISLTGLRSFFAPLMGVFMYEWLGFAWTYIFAMAFLLIAIYIMIKSQRVTSKYSDLHHT